MTMMQQQQQQQRIELAGTWYEALRVPIVPGMECLNVSIPSTVNADNLTLDLSYVTILNNSWSHSRDAVSFPWNNSTQYGIFHPDASEVSYKLVTTEYVSIAVVCGYGTTSVIPIFKLFTRDREVSEEIFELINTHVEDIGYSSLI
ncbi:GM25765 [Drosophila sechellia]|uniref:GM25765 n=1 Tax=Drosophila sechellia TaxID=7238 RepID=B4HLZ3_DROSE|nr:GM25765 [Drosophila sechellia]